MRDRFYSQRTEAGHGGNVAIIDSLGELRDIVLGEDVVEFVLAALNEAHPL